MKYHYQFVSKTSVRIELIPEDKKEVLLLAQLDPHHQSGAELRAYFERGLEAYATGAVLNRTNFMNHPKVALCTFTVKVLPTPQDCSTAEIR